MNGLSDSLIEWFSERPNWLQIAATRLLERGQFAVTDEIITEFVELCLQEADGNLTEKPHPFPASTYFQSATDNLRLCSISNVKGINALAPKKPLEFGKGNFTVVYGNNGSGKSGYVRTLKHICGARKPEVLHGNVYESRSVAQNASISFEDAGTPKSQIWSGQGPCDDLDRVEIFDNSFGNVFVSSEDEVSYEPPILTFFSLLITVCEKVATALDTEATRYPSKKPNILQDQKRTPEGIWFQSINADTTAQEIDKYRKFDETEESELVEIQQRLFEDAPADRARQLRIQQNHIDNLVEDAVQYLEQLSDENCQYIVTSKENWIHKKAETKTIAESTLSSSELEGIGTDSWKVLWEAAREYSNVAAYKNYEFPNVSQGSRCVLCHQTLTKDTKERFVSFENFVKGEFQKAETDAKRAYETAIQKLNELPTSETLKIKIETASSLSDEVINQARSFFAELQNRKIQVIGDNYKATLQNSLPSLTWIEQAKVISNKLKSSAENYEEDAKSGDREEIKEKFARLQAKKWLSEHYSEIKEEIERLTSLRQIQKAKVSTNTNALSRKKGELAEKLITAEFVQRFNVELKALGASQVKVELVKTKVSKGKVLHKIQLRRATKKNLTDILSDGEKRIVSIAAFLADANGSDAFTPLIFDDPISSLDQNYEECLIQRLVKLSRDKQIIVFTHRLSLLGTVNLFAKKNSINLDVVSIQIADWGTGEPAPMPLSQCKIGTTLNTLLNQQIRDARVAGANGEFEKSESIRKSICSDFRILVERSIENDLLCGVVQRFQRPVHSTKLMDLAKLNKSDCNLLDSLMTKYSYFEHSQPTDSPVELPTVDELSADMQELKDWRDNYRKRVA